MKHFSIIVRIGMLLAMLPAFLPMHARLEYSHFPASSPTASGHWVKVAVDESGIYEIPFSALTEMGFSDPTKVAVVGRGGAEMPQQFLVGVDDIASAPGGPQPIPVMLGDDKLYFYAQGVADICFEKSPGFSLGGAFKRVSFNQYTYRGYYMLTDAVEPVYIQPSEEPATTINVPHGVDYIHYEEDLVQNELACGQLFWGKTLTPSERTLTFDVEMPDLRTDIDGVIECSVHYNAYTANSMIMFGMATEDEMLSAAVPASIPYNYVRIPNAIGDIWLPHEKDEVQVTFSPRNAALPSKCYLDYWLLTWAKAVPSLRTEVQSRFTLPGINGGSGYSITATPASTVKVWDVSSATEPCEAIVKDGCVKGKAMGANPTLVWFDTARPQKQLAGFEVMANTNLHAKAADGADMLIITVPALRAQADELAAVHKADSGMEVMVAEVGDIYNEFSGGVPDVMAYKWLIKMLYMHPTRPLQHVLLFGPATSDVRGMRVAKDAKDWIIAFQGDNISRSAGATNPNDFLVMLSDYSTVTMSARRMDCSLGVLPVRNPGEAQIMLDKIKAYLADEDFAYILNTMVWMACPGDDHMSENSAAETLTRFYDYTDSSFIHPAVVADDFSSSVQARGKYIDLLRNGALMNLYFGHGDPSGLSKSYDLLSPVHLKDILNDKLSFAIFAGCSISNFDRDGSGIGEKMVLNLRNGLIGALIATRETYNNENKSFMNAFYKGMFLQEGSSTVKLNHMQTIGETYAAFKNRLAAANKFAFHLMCDPALVVPVPTLRISADDDLQGMEGSVMEIEGVVKDNEGNPIEDFNGEIVARLMLPAETRVSSNLLTHDANQYSYLIDDRQATISSAKVDNGRYKIRLAVPMGMDTSADATVALAAYDPTTRNAAASRLPLKIVENQTGSGMPDDVAPVVESVAYDVPSHAIDITVSDEHCLSYSNMPLAQSVEFSIDGVPVTSDAVSLRRVEDDGRRAFYRVKLNNIADGDHRVLVRAHDLMGNCGERESVVTVRGFEPTLTLDIAEISPAKVAFDVGNADGAWVLSIEDEYGMKVKEIKGEGGSAEWIISSEINPGLYRAFATSSGKYSAKVFVPIVR